MKRETTTERRRTMFRKKSGRFQNNQIKFESPLSREIEQVKTLEELKKR